MIAVFGEEKGVSSLTCILAAKIIGHRLQSNAFYYINSKYAYFHLYTYMYGTNCLYNLFDYKQYYIDNGDFM